MGQVWDHFNKLLIKTLHAIVLFSSLSLSLMHILLLFAVKVHHCKHLCSSLKNCDKICVHNLGSIMCQKTLGETQTADTDSWAGSIQWFLWNTKTHRLYRRWAVAGRGPNQENRSNTAIKSAEGQRQRIHRPDNSEAKITLEERRTWWDDELSAHRLK